MNPLQQIPVMKEGDFILRESEAIIKYVMDTRKVGDAYYPKDAKTRALINRYMAFHHSTFRPKLASAFVHCLFPEVFPADQDALCIGVNEACDKLQKFYLQGKKYIVGESLTIADIFAVNELVTVYETTGFNFKKFPEVYDYMMRCLENPCLKEVNEPLRILSKTRKNAGCLAGKVKSNLELI